MKVLKQSLNSSFEVQNVDKVLGKKMANSELKHIRRRFVIGLCLTSLISYDM